jgi:hypothetical protein
MADGPSVTPTTPGAARAIDSRVDLEQALKASRASKDQKRLLMTLFLDPFQSCADVGSFLGWDPTHTESISRSLQQDRRVGKALRARLAPYKEKSHQPRNKCPKTPPLNGPTKS